MQVVGIKVTVSIQQSHGFHPGMSGLASSKIRVSIKQGRKFASSKVGVSIHQEWSGFPSSKYSILGDYHVPSDSTIITYRFIVINEKYRRILRTRCTSCLIMLKFLIAGLHQKKLSRMCLPPETVIRYATSQL